MTEDAQGVMYIATTCGITMIDAGLRLSQVSDSRLAEAYIYDLRSGNDGLIYGLTQQGDLFTLRNGAVVDYLCSEYCRVKGIVSILPDPRKPGYMYLGTEGSNVYYGNLQRNFAAMGMKNVAPLPMWSDLNTSTVRSGSARATGSAAWTARAFVRWTTCP